VEYEAITCAGCHDPHDATKPHQLRNVSEVKLMDKKTVITEGGAGLICMDCHMTRRDATNYVEITAGSIASARIMASGGHARRLPLPMESIPSSAHRDVVEDGCATCHMQLWRPPMPRSLMLVVIHSRRPGKVARTALCI
jgi:hypothetical protein